MIPQIHPEQIHPEQVHPETEKLRKRAPRILLVEDVPDQAFLVGKILSNYKCDLTTVGDGAQAIEALRMQDFDLMLLDLGLPNQSGLDVMMHIKNHGIATKTPVIITTSSVGSQTLLRTLDLSFDNLLEKPFSPTQLVVAIQKLLERKRLNTAV